MTIELYGAPQSTCSQRVRFVLHAKQLPFQEHKLRLLEGDQLEPDYLKLNPNGVVPTLIHGGAVIIDSSVIAEYLDEAIPEPAPLRPTSLVEIAHMRSMMRFIDEVPAAAVRVPTFNLAFQPRFQQMSEAEFVAFAESKPLRKEFMLAMGRSGFPKKDMDQALGRLERTLSRMELWIAERGGPWLMGQRITLPDIMVMPAIVRMDDLNLSYMWTGRPTIARWFDAIRAHPAFKPTYYAGSLLTEQYPHLAELKAQAGAAQPGAPRS